jgi:hypothetical protein
MLHFDLDLVEALYALFSLYVDIHAHHFVGEDHSEVISLDPRSVRPRLSRAHSKLFNYLGLDLEVNLGRVDYWETEGKPETNGTVRGILDLWEDGAESVGDRKRSQIQWFFGFFFLEKQQKAFVLAEHFLCLFCIP